MKFTESSVKDLERVRGKGLKGRVRQAIEQIEAAQTLQEIGNVRKLQGGEGYYRIRIGDYRFGLVLGGETVIFVRFLHRKDLYRYSP